MDGHVHTDKKFKDPILFICCKKIMAYLKLATPKLTRYVKYGKHS